VSKKKRKPSEPRGKPGPKPTQLNWDEFDKLCAIQATLREIAGWFEVSEDTIARVVQRDKGIEFAVYSGQKRGPGKISLRRKQYEVAMKGNVGMLIWLGKQWLDQTEKSHSTGDDGDITLNVNLGGTEPKSADQPQPPGTDPTPA
jgi:hypothetical protein